MALSDKSFEFTSMLSEASVKDNQPIRLVPMDSSSPYFSPSLVSWDPTTLPLEFPYQSKSTDMQSQSQSQNNSTPDFWRWNNQDPKEMLYSNLDLETSAFDFPLIDTSYSSLQDHESWSASSSPISSSSQIPKSSTPQDTGSPAAFSFRSGSINGQTRKTKATKGERLEKRREKNRTSQRRYRERKEKYIQDLENQCKRLQERYDNLCARLIPIGGEGFAVEGGMQPCEEKTQWEWPEEGLGGLEELDLNRASGSVDLD